MRIVVKVAIVLCKVEPYSNRLHLNRTAVMLAPDDPEILNSSEFVLLANFTLWINPARCNYCYRSDTDSGFQSQYVLAHLLFSCIRSLITERYPVPGVLTCAYKQGLEALRFPHRHQDHWMERNPNNIQIIRSPPSKVNTSFWNIERNRRVRTLIVATIYLQLIQNRYMFRSFTVLHCSHQHCVQPIASDVEVVGYL